MTWRDRVDLWNWVVSMRRASDTSEADARLEFAAFFVVSEDKEIAAERLFVAVAKRGWILCSVLNMQRACDIDDEAAEHLREMAHEAEAEGISFSNLADETARPQ